MEPPPVTDLYDRAAAVLGTTRERNGKPVVAGFIEQHSEGTDLRVWCRWCCNWHTHGLTLGVGDYEDRSAHCYAPDSPFKRTGYVILVTDTPFSTMRRLMRTASVAQRAAISAGRLTAAVQRLREQPVPVG
jgi:hypothetical protein